jgi:spermidine/putrescine ABC transporter ATP-binding subunit
MKAQIDLRGVTKQFDTVTAVDNVDVSIAPGEFFTILGPSGSGKSTLLMILAGFLEATSGDVQIDGRSVLNLPPHLRSFGVVFQQYALFPNMTVYGNVAFPLQERRMPKDQIRERVSETLKLVELTGLADRKIDQLSGGQQQRVALARALVFDPPLLLMDEPLSALDRRLRETMQLELQQMQRRLGVTVIYVTHDQGEALTLSDRIAVMRDGKVIQIGPPREIYEQPVDAFVAGFLGESNLIRCRIEELGELVILTTKTGKRVFAQPQAARGHQVGDEISIVIRPEHVEVTAVDTAAVSSAFNHTGIVEEVTYLGENTRYVIDCEGERIVSRRQNTVGVPLVNRGADVAVSWPLAATQICR